MKNFLILLINPMFVLTLSSNLFGATLTRYWETNTPITTSDYNITVKGGNSIYSLNNSMFYMDYYQPKGWVITDIVLKPNPSYTGGNYTSYITLMDKRITTPRTVYKKTFTYNGQAIHLKDVWANFADSIKYIFGIATSNVNDQWLTMEIVGNNVVKNYRLDSAVYLTDAKPTINLGGVVGTVYRSGNYYVNYYSKSGGDSAVDWKVRSRDVFTIVNMISDSGTVIKHNGRTLTNDMIVKYCDDGLNNLIDNGDYGTPLVKPSKYPAVFQDVVHFTHNGYTYDTVYVINSNIVKKKLENTILDGSVYTLLNGKKINGAGVYIDSVAENVNDGFGRTLGNWGYDSLDGAMKLYSLTKEIISTQKNMTATATGSYILPSGKVVYSSGTYMDSLKYNAFSEKYYKIYKITLTVTAIVYEHKTINAWILSTGSFTLPSGEIINAPGIYQDTVNNTIYSVTVTTSTIKPLITATINLGSSYTLVSGKVVTEAGVYIDSTKAVKNGVDCYYLYTVTLSTVDIITATVNAISYKLPSGKQVNNTGIYNDTVKLSQNSIDYYKIYVINLTFTTELNQTKIFDVKVYPNPCRDFLKIEGLNDNSVVNLYNLNGKLLLSKGIRNDESIDVSNLKSGFYIIKIGSYPIKILKK